MVHPAKVVHMDDEASGGESVCYAHYFCNECGVLLDGRAHEARCVLALVGDSTTPTD